MLLRLLFRNVVRRKLRTCLTVCGIAVAILAFGLLRTVIDAWYIGVQASSANRLITRNAISLIMPLPLAYKERVEGLEGVTIVSYANWFGGIYIDEKNFFANFAVEPRSYLSLYPEFLLPDEQREAFLRDRKACIVGRKLAKRFGWNIGDTVTLRGTIFPGNWDFVIRAIYRGRDRSVDETQFFFHWAYLNERLKVTAPRRADEVGIYLLAITNPGLAAAMAKGIDGLFKNSFAETLTETEKAFQMSFVAMTETILMVIRVVSLVVIIIIMVVMANTMNMSVRERMGEYAVFKTLGFGGGYLTALILGESLVISALGGACGILCTFPAAEIFARELGAFFPVFHVSRATILMDCAAALIVGIVAGIFPAWRAFRVPIVKGLGRIG